MELLKFADLWQHLINCDESILIEAKRGTEAGKSCFETISAFSNEPDAGGGYLLFGVEPKRGSLFPDYEVTGVRNPDQLSCDLATQCRDSFSAPICPSIEVQTASNKTVLVAYIPEAVPHHKPVFIKSRGTHHGSYRRIAGTDQLCTDDDLALFFQSRGQRAFDENPVPESSLDDVDPAAIAVYREARRKAQTMGADAIAGYSDADLLYAVGATTKHAGSIVLTVAGLILFGKHSALRRHMPMMRVDYIRVDGREWVPNPEKRYQTIEKLGPLLTLAPQVVSQVLEDIPKAFYLPEGQVHRQDVPLIPTAVIREAIVNALMHRSFQKQQPVQVIRFSNRIEIRNPGYSLIPEERLGEPGSRTRNPKIACALHEVGLAETKGTGIRVMRQAMETANLTLPLIDSDRTRDEFRLRLLVHHLLSPEDIRWLGRFSDCNLSNDDARALILVREIGRIDNSTYRAINHVDTLTASRRLQSLRDTELLKQQGKGAGTFYTAGARLAPPPAGGPGSAKVARTREMRGEIEALRGEIEPLRGELPAELRGELESLRKRASPSEVDELIQALCNWRPLSLREISGLLGRSMSHIQDRYIKRLLKSRKLEYLFPDEPSSPKQRYVPGEFE